MKNTFGATLVGHPKAGGRCMDDRLRPLGPGQTSRVGDDRRCCWHASTYAHCSSLYRQSPPSAGAMGELKVVDERHDETARPADADQRRWVVAGANGELDWVTALFMSPRLTTLFVAVTVIAAHEARGQSAAPSQVSGCYTVSVGLWSRGLAATRFTIPSRPRCTWILSGPKAAAGGGFRRTFYIPRGR